MEENHGKGQNPQWVVMPVKEEKLVQTCFRKYQPFNLNVWFTVKFDSLYPYSGPVFLQFKISFSLNPS